MPLLKLPLERNYSEKWHIKRLSHSKFSMDINNCLSNHVKMGTRGWCWDRGRVMSSWDAPDWRRTGRTSHTIKWPGITPWPGGSEHCQGWGAGKRSQKISNLESATCTIKKRGHAKACPILSYPLKNSMITCSFMIMCKCFSKAFNPPQSHSPPLLQTFLWLMTDPSSITVSASLLSKAPCLHLHVLSWWVSPFTNPGVTLQIQSPSLCWRHFPAAWSDHLFLCASRDRDFSPPVCAGDYFKSWKILV